MGTGEFVYTEFVRTQISSFMGSVFEEICRQYLYRPDVYQTLPFFFGKLGRWWGTNPAKKREEEIDIVASGEGQMLFGECKWRNGKVDACVIQTLLERGELFACPEKYYFVFSKSGFDAGTDSLAEQFGVRRIAFEEML